MPEKVEKAKKLMSRFAFLAMLEFFKPKIVASVRESLNGITPEQLVLMIKQGEFPAIDTRTLSKVKDFEDNLDAISVKMVMEAVTEAREDLAQAIMSLDVLGYAWLMELRHRLIDSVKSPIQPAAQQVSAPLAEDTAPPPVNAPEMVKAVCECGHEERIPETEYNKRVKEGTPCPNCHKPANE